MKLYLSEDFYTPQGLFQRFMSGYAAKQPKVKLLGDVETNAAWFREDGQRMKPEYGTMYLRSILSGIRRSIDKGRLVSISKSLEKDIQ